MKNQCFVMEEGWLARLQWLFERTWVLMRPASLYDPQNIIHIIIARVWRQWNTTSLELLELKTRNYILFNFQNLHIYCLDRNSVLPPCSTNRHHPIRLWTSTTSLLPCSHCLQERDQLSDSSLLWWSHRCAIHFCLSSEKPGKVSRWLLASVP